ncbi:MAG: GNAT family N-acetyltransferase [Candidatus Krumholzibacteriota bacterium]|nr:GNAT family N-acetyltransferase [Candidatus Krumholzibacteriota bacterium]
MNPDAIHIERIESPAVFAALEGDWNRCLAASPDDAVHLRHEWLRCWYAADPGRRPPCVLVAREDDRLVGMTALTAGALPLKRWRLPALASATSGVEPRWSAVAEAGREDVMDALVADLRRRPELPGGARARAFLFENLAEDGPGARAWLGAWRRAGTPVYLEPGRRSPCLRIPAGTPDYETLWRGFCSKHQRRILRQKLRRAEGAGLRAERVTDPARVRELMDTVFAVSARSWKGAGGTDMAGSASSRSFYDAFTPVAAERGWLSLWLLWDGGVCAAIQYDLEYGGVATAFRSDFDPERAPLSPGLVLRWHSLQDFVARGGRTFDFGGQDYGYKRHWTDAVRGHAHAVVPAPGMTSRALVWARNNPLMARARGVGGESSLAD